MALRLPSHKPSADRRAWHGTAFVLEALLLLFFLTLFIVVLVQLQTGTHVLGNNSDRLSSAVVLAANDAETFAADPTAQPETHYFRVVDGAFQNASADEKDSLAVTRLVRSEAHTGGTLYFADISVIQNDELVYELSTSRYLSSQGGIA